MGKGRTQLSLILIFLLTSTLLLAPRILHADEVDKLIMGLKIGGWRYRRDAAEALGKIGDKRAVEPLIKALGDKKWYVRRAAAEALGKIGDRRAIDPLVNALGDINQFVCKAAAEALEALGEPLGWIIYKTLHGDKQALAHLIDKRGSSGK